MSRPAPPVSTPAVVVATQAQQAQNQAQCSALPAAVTPASQAAPAVIPAAGVPKTVRRKGSWTTEEEKYARKLIRTFQGGFLDIKDGTSLRGFLSTKLRCNPLRVSKKFFLGKQFFSPTIRYQAGLTAVKIEQRMRAEAAELQCLEAQFLSGLQQQAAVKSKAPGAKRRKVAGKADTCKVEKVVPTPVCKVEPVDAPPPPALSQLDFDDVAINCFELLNDGFESEGSDDFMDDLIGAVVHKQETSHFTSPPVTAATATQRHECPFCCRQVHTFTSFGNSYFCFECGLA